MRSFTAEVIVLVMILYMGNSDARTVPSEWNDVVRLAPVRAEVLFWNDFQEADNRFSENEAEEKEGIPSYFEVSTTIKQHTYFIF